MKESPFFKQADLLVQVLPFIHAELCFALKGGTAINFFVRDFPRLSVEKIACWRSMGRGLSQSIWIVSHKLPSDFRGLGERVLLPQVPVGAHGQRASVCVAEPSAHGWNIHAAFYAASCEEVP